MPHRAHILHFSPNRRPVPATIQRLVERDGYRLISVPSADELFERLSRAYPVAVVLDGSGPEARVIELCRQVKADAFTAVVPVIVYVESGGEGAVAMALEAGADEVLTPQVSDRQNGLRAELALRRADRDLSVHPTTRLPGTIQIERDFARRLHSGERFAVCYADLDHFKEFNDRYGYNHGDCVILIVSRILREVVRAHAPDGFVGHIGGDDFIFNVPHDALIACCEDVLTVFDELIPLQYSPEDRSRGYFIGEDRRGKEYEVPLMTLSIGVVTNAQRELLHTGQISELATEMKAYAKSLSGSRFVVDRRTT